MTYKTRKLGNTDVVFGLWSELISIHFSIISSSAQWPLSEMSFSAARYALTEPKIPKIILRLSYICPKINSRRNTSLYM